MFSVFVLSLLIQQIVCQPDSSDNWAISSNVVISEETAQFVQLHPTMNGIAYGVRRTAGLDTINITNVNDIQLVYTNPTNNDYWRIHSSKVNNKLYVAALGGGIILYDIMSDPWKPAVIGYNLDLNSSNPSTITQMTVDSNYVYAVGAKTKAFLAILSHDLKTVHGFWEETTLPGVTGLQSVYVIGDNKVAAGDGESLLRIFDITDINNINVIGSIEIGNVNTWIYCITSAYNDANTLLATHTQSGIYAVDITDPSNPTTAEQIDEALGGAQGGSPYWMERVDNIGYVANGNAGISIIDLTNIGSFSVINYVNDGPMYGPIASSLNAYGIVVFGDNNQFLLMPTSGQSSTAGYLIMSKEETPDETTTNPPNPIISTTANVESTTDLSSATTDLIERTTALGFATTDLGSATTDLSSETTDSKGVHHDSDDGSDSNAKLAVAFGFLIFELFN